MACAPADFGDGICDCPPLCQDEGFILSSLQTSSQTPPSSTTTTTTTTTTSSTTSTATTKSKSTVSPTPPPPELFKIKVENNIGIPSSPVPTKPVLQEPNGKMLTNGTVLLPNKIVMTAAGSGGSIVLIYIAILIFLLSRRRCKKKIVNADIELDVLSPKQNGPDEQGFCDISLDSNDRSVQQGQKRGRWHRIAANFGKEKCSFLKCKDRNSSGDNSNAFGSKSQTDAFGSKSQTDAFGVSSSNAPFGSSFTTNFSNTPAPKGDPFGFSSFNSNSVE